MKQYCIYEKKTGGCFIPVVTRAHVVKTWKTKHAAIEHGRNEWRELLKPENQITAIDRLEVREIDSDTGREIAIYTIDKAGAPKDETGNN